MEQNIFKKLVGKNSKEKKMNLGYNGYNWIGWALIVWTIMGLVFIIETEAKITTSKEIKFWKRCVAVLVAGPAMWLLMLGDLLGDLFLAMLTVLANTISKKRKIVERK